MFKIQHIMTNMVDSMMNRMIQLISSLLLPKELYPIYYLYPKEISENIEMFSEISLGCTACPHKKALGVA